MPICHIPASSQIPGDSGELAAIEFLQQTRHVPVQRLKYLPNLMHSLQGWMERLLALVVRVGLAAQVSRPFQPGHYACDGTRSQSRDCSKVTTGERPALAHQVEALKICRAHPQKFSQCVVQQHHCSAVPSRQVTDDLLCHLLLALGRLLPMFYMLCHSLRYLAIV